MNQDNFDNKISKTRKIWSATTNSSLWYSQDDSARPFICYDNGIYCYILYVYISLPLLANLCSDIYRWISFKHVWLFSAALQAKFVAIGSIVRASMYPCWDSHSSSGHASRNCLITMRSLFVRSGSSDVSLFLRVALALLGSSSVTCTAKYEWKSTIWITQKLLQL